MGIQVNRPEPRGSVLSSIMSIGSGAKNAYSLLKSDAPAAGPTWTTGTTDFTKNALGGQDDAAKLGGQADDFTAQMNAINSRMYTMNPGKAVGMDGELAGAAADAAGGGAGAGAAGYGATNSGAFAGGYAGADAAAASIAALA